MSLPSPIFPLLLAALATPFPENASTPSEKRAVRAAEVTIASPVDTPRPPFRFTLEDERLLDEVQRGAFNFLWNAADPDTGMVWDRSSKRVISVAGVGFQLAAIPVGVERGFITREQGEERTLRILRALVSNPDNRKAGLYYHYLAPGSAGPSPEGYEQVVSTIDSALLLAGVTVAGSYWGGEIGEVADRMLAEADWRFFVSHDDPDPWERGFVSLGWKPADAADPTGDGKLLPYYWIDSGDEHRLVAFLGVAAPSENHRLPPEDYYKLRRMLGKHPAGADDSGTMVWFPWSGALFTSFFAHCFIDYAHIPPDQPSAFNVEHRAAVDWWENARRHVNMHRSKAKENPHNLPTFGENAWGLTACDASTGYIVPGLFPIPLAMTDARPGFDFVEVRVKDNYGDGTIAPYGAGSSIMFEPEASLAALRYYRGLTGVDGTPLIWHDPARGGWGFRDSFRFGPGNTPISPETWVAEDCVAIDQGPLLLAIENARSGLVWDLFHRHPTVQGAMERLKLRRESASK